MTSRSIRRRVGWSRSRAGLSTAAGHLLGAVRTVRVEPIDVERVRSVMPAVFAVALVLSAFAALLVVATLEIAR